MSAIRGARQYVPAPIRERYVMKVGVAILVVILLISAVGGYMYVQTSAELQSDAEHRLSAAAEAEGVAISDWIDSLERSTRLVAHTDTLMRSPPSGIESYLAEELQSGGLPPSVTAAHFYNTAGNSVVASTAESAAGATADELGVPWRDTVTSLSAGEVAVSDPYTVSGSDTPVMAVMTTVPERKARALVFRVDLASRSEKLAHPVENSNVVVVNEHGTTVLSHHLDAIGTENMQGEGVNSMAVENALNGQSGYTQMKMDGRSLAIGYAPVEGTDLAVLTRAPTSSVFAVKSTVSRNLLVMLLVAVLGLGLVGATIGRNTARDVRRLATRAEAIRDGDFDTTVETDREDEIGTLYETIADLRDSLHENIEEAEAAKEEAERRQAELREEAEHLETVAERYHDVMDDAASGDLTRRMTPDEENQAMAEIAQAYNGMMDELETTMAQVKQFAATVVASSRDVQTSAEEVRAASQEVTESIQEISEGTAVQNDNLAEVSAEMNDLSATIEEVASSATEASETARETEELGVEVQEIAEEVQTTMAEVQREAGESIDEIEALQEEMAQIEEIVDFITDIAEQTNILALNASIEAARAGEAGEGFAVVADEVKSLAEETREAAEEIEDLIVSIQDQSAETVREVGETNDEVAAASEMIDESIDSLEEIAAYAEETNTAVQEISHATDEQATSTQEVVSMVDEVSSVSEQTSEEAQTVSAAAEEQTSAINEVASSIESLADRSGDLDSALEEFRTSPEGGGDVDAAAAGADQTVATDGDGDTGGFEFEEE